MLACWGGQLWVPLQDSTLACIACLAAGGRCVPETAAGMGLALQERAPSPSLSLVCHCVCLATGAAAPHLVLAECAWMFV